MVNIEHGKVFSDWLSISYAASQTPYSEILSLLGSLSETEERLKGAKKTLYQFPEAGSLQVTHEDTYHNFSFSGSLLAALRRLPEHRDFVIALASTASNVTRLDVSLDLPIPAYLVIRSIDRIHKDGIIEVAGHSRRIQYITDGISGEPTGTVYLQHKNYSGYVEICIYDKSKEVHEKRGIIIPPTTRYEIRIKKGASLRDYSEPMAAFWHYMPETILPKPKDVLIPTWGPTERVEYDDKPAVHTTDYETLRYLIQHSASLKALISKCLSVNGGSNLLLKEIQSALESRRDYSDTGAITPNRSDARNNL